MAGPARSRRGPAIVGPHPHGGNMDRLLTAAELAEILSIPVPQVWTLVRREQIPAYRVGRLYRFDLAVVLKTLHVKQGT
jgi:excisionase family DNA binding protein